MSSINETTYYGIVQPSSASSREHGAPTLSVRPEGDACPFDALPAPLRRAFRQWSRRLSVGVFHFGVDLCPEEHDESAQWEHTSKTTGAVSEPYVLSYEPKRQTRVAWFTFPGSRAGGPSDSMRGRPMPFASRCKYFVLQDRSYRPCDCHRMNKRFDHQLVF